MTDEQKETLTHCLGAILQFYVYGRQGAVMRPGGFVELFKVRCPDLYAGNEEFIEMIDNLVMASYRAGRNAAPPFTE